MQSTIPRQRSRTSSPNYSESKIMTNPETPLRDWEWAKAQMMQGHKVRRKCWGTDGMCIYARTMLSIDPGQYWLVLSDGKASELSWLNDSRGWGEDWETAA